MKDSEVAGYTVDKNGQNKNPIYYGDRIIRKKSVDSFVTKKKREKEALRSGDKQEWNLEKFFKGHIPEIRELQRKLTPYQRSLLFSISTYVGYEDCCLKKDNGDCLSFDDIVEISCLSKSKTSEVLNELRKLDIIYKGTNSKGFQYFINPWLFCKGTRINSVLKTMFKNYKVLVLGGRAWGDIGSVEFE